jgi:dihydrofolate synthase / folylpolyglutamate synthase
MADAFERLFALETFGIKLGLDNISRLCAALGHPERSFESLHIAGTNGKGSVTAMAHAALVAAGIPAARFISPHLTELTERFVIGRDAVDPQTLQAVSNDVLDCADRLIESGELQVHPTFFEATTAIAFELFRRAGVKAAVIEVGLGGRFDSTNVVPATLGAITSIGLDHQDLLGDTVQAIAQEKAGIIKPGMTVVIGPLAADAYAVVTTVAASQRAHVVESLSGTRLESDVRDGRTTLTVETPVDRYGPITLALRGDHQVSNALVAIRLLEAARARGIHVPREAIEQGLSEAEWPGRLELLDIGEGARVLLDSAHNVDGARALAAYLERWHPERPVLVLGSMRDKDVAGIIDVLLPVVSTIVATAANSPRAIPARELAARLTAAGAAHVEAEPDPVAAVERALVLGPSVCVAGSIFLVGAVRGRLRQRAILR